MNKVIESYIDPGFRYDFTKGPDVVRSREDALRNGINCVSLAHLVLRDMFDYELPAELFCTEMYFDRQHFTSADSDTNLQLGDLVWLGTSKPTVRVEAFVPRYAGKELVNWSDFPVNHVAIATGETNPNGDALLLHSTHITGTNVIWSSQAFQTHPGHEQVYGITRLKTAS